MVLRHLGQQAGTFLGVTALEGTHSLPVGVEDGFLTLFKSGELEIEVEVAAGRTGLMNLYCDGVDRAMLEGAGRDGGDQFTAFPDCSDGRTLWGQRALLKVASRHFLTVKVDGNSVIVGHHEAQFCKFIFSFRRGLERGAEIGGERFVPGIITEQDPSLHIVLSVAKGGFALFPFRIVKPGGGPPFPGNGLAVEVAPSGFAPCGEQSCFCAGDPDCDPQAGNYKLGRFHPSAR